MGKVAFLFSGQGAQYAGMGVKLQQYPEGRETLQEANDVLGMDIAHICCNGTDEELARTEITQPAIVTCSIAALRILIRDPETPVNDRFSFQAFGKGLKAFFQKACVLPAAVAGLSVGEYSALVAAGSLRFADALKLVKERGQLMAEAAAANPGTMVAILGLDNAVVISICREASALGTVSPANFNCPGQVVISGEEAAVKQAVELAQKAGARMCKALNVGGAFHSALMHPAETGLRKALVGIPFSKPQVPFIANVTGEYAENPEEIKEMLVCQLSSSIQWEASIRRMIDDSISSFVEVGPGKVLAGLTRRICKEAEISNTDDMI